MRPATQKKPQSAKQPAFIYLVDDEELVLDVAEATLEPEGFRIKKFGDPEEAWKSFQKERTKPALLITDYAMGKMNGLELIEKCKEEHPQLKTLLISGVASAEVQLNAAIPADRYLAKPYPPQTLAETVRELLEAA
jgi:DNA-binding NtrC family response regulator